MKVEYDNLIMSSSRPSEHLAIGFSQQAAVTSNRSNSPSSVSSNDPSGGSLRPSFGLAPGLVPHSKMPSSARSGAGSPSREMTGSQRLYSKRAREIQAQEGVPGMPVNMWGGPPTSGNSTPLRENIPESPTDGFPDFTQLPTHEGLPQHRRARAGTVPSRFSPGGVGNPMLNPGVLSSKSSRATPSQSPYPTPSPGLEPPDAGSGSGTGSGASVLLSRLRSGSMTQRPYPQAPGTSSPFGPSYFSSWNPTRERRETLASIPSVGSNGPSSPSQSQFSREATGETDVHMRTLDYLGLAETPQPPRAQLAAQLATPYMPNFADLKSTSRFRSYSVNNKDKYADEEDDEYEQQELGLADMPSENALAQIQSQIAATHVALRHNYGLQQFVANQAAISRPRARTAGVLDSPGNRALRTFMPAPSRLDSSMTPNELCLNEEEEFKELSQTVAGMTLGPQNIRNNGLVSTEEQGPEGPTSALWLGSIPTSTTTSTLNEMFKSYGTILSSRVLTHKNCGFVNFERIDSAIAAKASMNGKEIFPGNGPIRVNFAKPPSASNTPGHDDAFPSPSPDPFSQNQESVGSVVGQGSTGVLASATFAANVTPTVAPLTDMTGEILTIVKQFGATDEDKSRISERFEAAICYDSFVDEVPPIKDPAPTRIHDAPKLRDIRKRIDNNTLTQAEIEGIARDMLPEIAELSSDYLGNTVVQKLFEYCSDDLRDSMLEEIAPHMAEIGVHKNGTWAAQKIIDVCKTPHQMSTIVKHLHPYTVPLFLDQYGNYVLQGCLKFGSPYNDFIFETMLSKMWEVAQGRYGARAMRACLESHHATKNQQRILAAAIALHSVQLATNANGALLLTWFLDTCTFPQRRTVLSPQLVPYLVHLCKHRVAYLTVLKMINQKAEGDARDTILKALFFSDNTLEAILSDHACGATLIFKVLTTPFLDDATRVQVMEKVKNVLVRIKAQPGQGYKRLMDEVGLSTRAGGGGNIRDHGHLGERPRPGSRQASGTSGQLHHSQQQGSMSQQQPPPTMQGHPQQNQQVFNGNSNGNHFYNPLHAGVNPSNYEMGFGIPRSESVEPSLSQQFPAFGTQNPLYVAANGPMGPLQMPYLQNMMGRVNPSVNYYASLQPGFGGFQSASPSVDHYRGPNLSNGSPNQGHSAQLPNMPANPLPFGGAPGFAMNMGGFNSYHGGGGMQNLPFMQEPVNSRRGRR